MNNSLYLRFYPVQRRKYTDKRIHIEDLKKNVFTYVRTMYNVHSIYRFTCFLRDFYNFHPMIRLIYRRKKTDPLHFFYIYIFSVDLSGVFYLHITSKYPLGEDSKSINSNPLPLALVD